MTPNVAIVRQFARAVLADRLLGDELTRLALTKAELDPQADPEDPRDLIRAFLRTWRFAADKDKTPAALFSDTSLLEALPAPPDEGRLMLLLVDAIGFSSEDAATILAPMKTDAAEALSEGRKILTEPRSGSTAIIIEDEPLIAAELLSILERMGVSVGGYANTAAKAVALANRTQPDVILADYNLEDGETGADAVEQIHNFHSCPVIFITGFPEKVLSGEGVEPDFVISKPYRVDAVRAAVAHCLDARVPVLAD